MQLFHPSPNAYLALIIDATDFAQDAAMHQWGELDLQPLSFISSELSNTEKKYSVYDREFLAKYAFIRHFRFKLEGRTFTLYTGYKHSYIRIRTKKWQILHVEMTEIGLY